jgi:hypothetical protein
MDTEYFIIINKVKKGPFSAKEITLLNLKNETPIWYSELTNWTTFGDLRKNNPYFANTPPPFEQSTNSYLYLFIKKNISITLGLILILGIILYNLNSGNFNSTTEYPTSDSTSISQDENEIKKERIKQLTIKNRNYRNNWSEYIIAERSSYNYSDFGGIYNLSIFITNKTEYKLAQVQVAVDYIKAAGGIYKTEYIVFENVKPESKMVLSAPNSERGTKIEYRICNIYAPSFYFCYNETIPVGNGSLNDPWRCMQ